MQVNNATRFTVAIYQVKRRDIKDVGAEMMSVAIRNTLPELNLNIEIIAKCRMLNYKITV